MICDEVAAGPGLGHFDIGGDPGEQLEGNRLVSRATSHNRMVDFRPRLVTRFSDLPPTKQYKRCQSVQQPRPTRRH